MHGIQDGMELWPRQAVMSEQHPQGCSSGLGDSGVTMAEPWGLCHRGAGGWSQGPGSWCAMVH